MLILELRDVSGSMAATDLSHPYPKEDLGSAFTP